MSGEDVALMLPRGEILRGGDKLQAVDGRVIEVIAAPEQVLHVECATPTELTRAAYLTDTTNAGEMRVFESLRDRAKALGATVDVYDAVQPGALDASLEAIVRDRNEGLAVGLTAAMLVHKDRIVQFAAKRKLPAV